MTRVRGGTTRLRSATARVTSVLGLIATILVTVSFASPVAGASGGGEWTTYGGSSTRASDQSASPKLTPLHEFWLNDAIDGQIYGEPLIDGGRVYVATESDIVYALSGRNGKVIWRRSIGQPIQSGVLPCGDIGPTEGITSTMVLDPTIGRLFTVGAVAAAGGVRHEFVAIDAADGRVVFRRFLDQRGWDTTAFLQRAGLGLDDGRVLVGFGGNYGDCAQYRGTLIAVPESGVGANEVFTVPTSREGAIWAPSGESILPDGDILVGTGNSASQGAYDGGVSVDLLTAGLRRLSYFAPSDWRQDNAGDADLGSSAPIPVADGQVLAAGKSGVAYLLALSHLGGIGGQLTSTSVCSSYGGDARVGAIVVIGCNFSPPVALKVGPHSLRTLWNGPGGVSGSPTIAGGVVWGVGNGELTGLSLGSGRLISGIRTVSTEHFAAPSAGEGLLVVGGDGAVEAYAGPHGYLG
jgi:hypothetical protein